MQVARRVEEMRAKPVAAEGVGSTVSERGDGDARVFEETIVPPVRTASTRSSSACLMSSCSTTHSMMKSTPASRGRSLSRPPMPISDDASGVKNGSGLSARARFSPSRALSREVEQQRGHAGVRDVGGDLRAHGAGAKDRDRSNRNHVRHPLRALRVEFI